ncbi:MAG TPA: helix-turn-helix domain-containing protein [Solirubrobacterales bacterium]|nr:helix-turn-helix domain-containing protein [Solirubrobacterales bacterium]
MSEGRLQRRGGARSTEARSLLAERLRERLPELRGAIATRVYAISDPRDVADPGYLERLNDAVAAAVEYRLSVLEAGERNAPPVPAVLLGQARLDARDGVPLDTVLRRYFAGSSLFGDFLVEEAERAEVSSASLRQLLAAQATIADRLIAAVSSEHAREAKSRPTSPAERRRECVKSLLAGELVDHSDLGYDLDAHHLALMAKGPGVEELVRTLAKQLDRRLLAVGREEEPVWACWLGGQRPLAAEDALAAVTPLVPGGAFVTVGEPGEGLGGWRFSHQQAKAALPIAERSGRPAVRYADVAVLAAIDRDEMVAKSLRQLYLAPLAAMRDGGKLARQTLRAYFEAERNVSSTAAALGVDRRTVRNRLRAIEEQLGRPLTGSLAELEIALRLAE